MIKKKFFRLAFDFYERWFPCPANKTMWERCTLDGAMICSENGNDPFLKDLMAAVYHELSRNKDRGHESETNNADHAA